MKTLITGATGFVGSAVLRRLLSAGHDVRALVRPESNQRNISGMPIEIVHGDLRDPVSLHRAVKDCSTLFHVAADYRLWVPQPREIYEANVNGSRNMILAATAAGVEKIVYTSSVAVLGLNGNGTPADENTPAALTDMVGHYKRSKFLAEAEVRILAERYDLPVIIVNPSTPVGPGDIKPTPTGRMIIDAASGRMPAYVDTGLNFVHVDDVAKGHLLAAERGRIGERYILGSVNLSLKDALVEIAKLTGLKAPRVRLPHCLILTLAAAAEAWSIIDREEPRLNLTGARLARKKMYFSTEKAQRELGFRTRPIRDAFSDSLEWFRKNGYIR